MQVKKQQLELDMEQQSGSKSGKEYVKAVYCHPAYSTYMQGTSWETLGWRNINNLRYADDTTLMAESKEELKSLLIKVKGKSEKAGLNSTFRKLRSWHPVPSLHGKQMGKQCKQWQTLFWGLQKSLQVATVAMKLKDARSYDKPRQHIKKAETLLCRQRSI